MLKINPEKDEEDLFWEEFIQEQERLNREEEIMKNKDIIEEKYTRYLNCETDIIELTLEEAKFILETGERRNYVTSILQEAGKVLLSDYKRLESENKEFLYKYGNVLKENKELNEKWDKDTHKLQNDLDIANAKIIELLKENEELNKNYNSLIDKIILKIDEYDYKFEKAKRQNKNDIADYYWDLIGNFKKLLGGE